MAADRPKETEMRPVGSGPKCRHRFEPVSELPMAPTALRERQFAGGDQFSASIAAGYRQIVDMHGKVLATRHGVFNQDLITFLHVRESQAAGTEIV
jgi:hypothetical protein